MTGEGDVVFVQGIEFEASHGYSAAERRGTRRFRCHLEVRRDLVASARTDRLTDTVDYRALCGIVVEVGTKRTFRLLEALAGAVADAVHDRYPRLSLTVTIEKVAPPCPGAPAVAGVRIFRPARRPK
jgi:7,8-dihydroneopterin aldolase/epimerase/oxygenase